MTVRAPIVVCPVKCTWATSRTPSPMTTWEPMTQYGPIDRVGSDHRPFFDLGGRSNLSHRLHPTTSMAPTSASATVWFPTLASPRYHHMFFFRFFLVM